MVDFMYAPDWLEWEPAGNDGENHGEDITMGTSG